MPPPVPVSHEKTATEQDREVDFHPESTERELVKKVQVGMSIGF